MVTRDELLAALRLRYGTANRGEKARILDELTAVAGYHRQHAIRLLTHEPGVRRGRRPQRRVYGAEFAAALTVVWEAADRICSKGLKPLIQVLVPALERHGRLRIDDVLWRQLSTVSAATMDRLPAEARTVARGGQRRRAGFGSAVRRSVTVKTFGDRHDPPLGFVEVDLVAHAGASSSGAFVQTLVMTDIANGWTECPPLLLRESAILVDALERAVELFPLAPRCVDFDNDSTFMNEPVVDWCRRRGLEVTRSRAYRKNDKARVEQKNGAIVRRLVGYGRFEGRASVAAVARLYAAARLHGKSVPAVVQAALEDRDRGSRRRALPCPRATGGASPGASCAGRDGEGGTAPSLPDRRPGSGAGGGARRPGRARSPRRCPRPRAGRGSADAGGRAADRRPRNGVARRRAPSDASPPLSSGRADAAATVGARRRARRDRGMVGRGAGVDGLRRA
jgi:hypothetical protein